VKISDQKMISILLAIAITQVNPVPVSDSHNTDEPYVDLVEKDAILSVTVMTFHAKVEGDVVAN